MCAFFQRHESHGSYRCRAVIVCSGSIPAHRRLTMHLAVTINGEIGRAEIRSDVIVGLPSEALTFFFDQAFLQLLKQWRRRPECLSDRNSRRFPAIDTAVGA